MGASCGVSVGCGSWVVTMALSGGPSSGCGCAPKATAALRFASGRVVAGAARLRLRQGAGSSWPCFRFGLALGLTNLGPGFIAWVYDGLFFVFSISIIFSY